MVIRKIPIAIFASLAAQSSIAAPVSPDGSKIVYSYIGGPESLYIANADGSDERELIVREQRDFRPEWAPDGSHIIFTTVEDGKHVIVTVKPDGSELTSISQSEEAAGGADYSSDGSKLVYFTDEPQPRDLFLRNLKTGKSKALTHTLDFEEMSPRWSPDNKHVVFVGKDKSEGAESDIWVINSETGERQNLTQTETIGEFHPDFSHDGNHVVYIQVVSGAFNVAVRNVETLDERIVATGNSYAVLSPHFSPDDQSVIFTRTDFAEKGPDMPAIVSVSLEDGSETVIARNLYLSQME